MTIGVCWRWPTACLVVAATCGGGAVPAHAGVTCPPWMRQAAAATLTPEQAQAPAVVLLDDRTTTVEPDGMARTRHLYVARIATREGRSAASLSEVYLTDSGRIRQARGWIIRPSGEVQELSKDHVADAALALNDVYNEARVRIVNAGEPEAGLVFGAEIVAEDRSVFTQFEWALQRLVPVKQVRRVLTVPEGWRVSSTTFNRDDVLPVVTGSSYSWQLADVPPAVNEPGAPPWRGTAARLAVGYVPAPAVPGLAGFSGWPDVSRWLAGLSDAQAVPDAAMTAKARELTAQAPSEWEKIRAIGAYVRRVPYISIQIGVGRGGGYRPRPASQVFARNHGDCKDKANLMRAMLASIGIRSFLVSAYSSDPGYVREAWPSPQQFNHCILAVVLSDKAPAEAPVVESPAHGRLLIVDPTAEFTAVGSLPADERGGLALLIAPDGGLLTRLPEAPAGTDAVERAVEGAVMAGGSLSATVRTISRGEPASAERQAAAALQDADYRLRLERRMAADLGTARLSDVSRTDTADAFELTMRVSAPAYGQVMQQRLLVLVPPFRTTGSLPALTAPTRSRPVWMDAELRVEALRLEMPKEFEQDELPQPAAIDSPFGRYTLTAGVRDGRIVVERRLAVRRGTVPAAEYKALRSFLDAVRAADTSPIVLRRRQ